MSENNTKTKQKSGFTIIELLVVIAVIGIISTIVFVSYGGVTRKASILSIQSDLSNAIDQLAIDKFNDGTYPTSESEVDGGNGFKLSDGTTLDYQYRTSDGSYCVMTSNSFGDSYHASSDDKTIAEGICSTSYIVAWGNTLVDEMHGIVQSDDGGYATVGSTSSYGTSSSYDAVITKYQANGEISWSRAWGGTGVDVGNSIVKSSDGGYVIAGDTRTYGTSASYDAFIAKYSSVGALEWSKTWGDESLDKSKELINTSDGGYLLTGWSSYGVDSDYDALLVKYSADGTLEWDRTWGGLSDEYGYSTVQTADGGYAVTGVTYSYETAGDVFLTKFTSTGDFAWSQGWGGANVEYGYSLAQISNDNLVIVGYTRSFNDDLLVLEYTSSGALVKSRTWGGPGATGDAAIDVLKTDDGYVMTGSTASYGNGSNDTLIAKFTTSGDVSWAKIFGSSLLEQGRSIIEAEDAGYAVASYTTGYGNGSYESVLIKYEPDGSIRNCPTAMCGDLSMSLVDRSATAGNPELTTTDPVATTGAPSASSREITVLTTTIVEP